MSSWVAAFIAVFIWWFSTGIILMTVKRADRLGAAARRSATLKSLPIALLGALGFVWSLPQETVLGVYVAFLSALALWGWIELAFLTGTITGPNTYTLPPYTSAWERFIRAWGTLAYHESLLIAVLLVMLLASWGAANTFAFWTFAILWAARISAKLNLFFGVPRINVDFLPEALGHLPSHFRRAPMNWLFPVSITGLTFAVACWLERLYAAETSADATGFALLTALTALALFEHWVMVLPVPDDRLWRWMMPTDHSMPKPDHRTTKTLTKTGGHHGL